VADADLEAYARARLASARVDMERVAFVEIPYDDTWLRDTGPITLAGEGAFRLLDFRVTGWGGKFEAGEDDQLVARLAEMGIFSNSRVQTIDFALEGGAIDTDGQGTLLTTWQCLSERHPFHVHARGRQPRPRVGLQVGVGHAHQGRLEPGDGRHQGDERLFDLCQPFGPVGAGVRPRQQDRGLGFPFRGQAHRGTHRMGGFGPISPGLALFSTASITLSRSK
jgi:hypothetical protein